MSLSVAIKREAKATDRPRAAPIERRLPPLIEFEAWLPDRLFRLGPSVRASVHGPADAPVVVILGGISADRFPSIGPDGTAGWWPGLVGSGCAVDPRAYRILGIDFAADELGLIAPTSCDQAEVVLAALDAIKVERAHAIVGASYGGMTALALGQHFPHRAERLVVVSAGAAPHPSATAIRELQRRVVALGLANGTGVEALSIARGLAMITYRTQAEFEARFAGGISGEDVLSPSEPGAYLKARGDAYRAVMSPHRFLSLSASIDRHQVDPEAIKPPTLVIGAQTDQLVPASQLTALAEQLGGPSELHLLPSLYGHDMFLKDADRLSDLVAPFLESAA